MKESKSTRPSTSSIGGSGAFGGLWRSIHSRRHQLSSYLQHLIVEISSLGEPTHANLARIIQQIQIENFSLSFRVSEGAERSLFGYPRTDAAAIIIVRGDIRDGDRVPCRSEGRRLSRSCCCRGGFWLHCGTSNINTQFCAGESSAA